MLSLKTLVLLYFSSWNKSLPPHATLISVKKTDRARWPWVKVTDVFFYLEIVLRQGAETEIVEFF